MPPILALDKISKRFGAIVIADGIDLALAPGEALGIIGPNGAGKTTLFGIMTGNVAPDAGRVMYEGADITHAAPARRCRMGIARSFQIPQPFGDMTVFENLVVAAAFGAGRRERDAYGPCMEILEQCGLAAAANRRAGSLTLIDRKRLELARALATNPRLLLLDEVAGGLTEHLDHLDRACGACPDGHDRPPGGAARRPVDRAGRSADRDPQPGSRRHLSRDRGRCLIRPCSR
jgi:branched-chain amino acid transport system ATP-binding protein